MPVFDPLNPQKYFDLLEQAITSSHFILEYKTEGPTARPNSPDWIKRWSSIMWRGDFIFHSQHTGLAFEQYLRNSDGSIEKKLAYRLLDSNGEIMFRMDTHGRPIPYNFPCHLHQGSKTVKDGDKRLDGVSLLTFDFLDFWSLAQDHVEKGSLPCR